VADILHEFPIKTAPARVFHAVSQPEGLDHWWTRRSSGSPSEGAEYRLWFGPDYDWAAIVTRCVPDTDFEVEVVRADGDWTGTRVAFHFERHDAGTWVRFSHLHWPAPNEHYRISCFCWAMYLRILRRWLEHGETVDYERRLDV
jgi:uncharacterized protein YndB with AHSA1/START domain